MPSRACCRDQRQRRGGMRAGRSCAVFALPYAPPSGEERDRCEPDDDENDERQVLFGVGNSAAEKIAKEREASYPNDGAGDIIKKEHGEPHVADSGKDVNERARYWHKARKENRRSPVALKKVMRKLHVAMLKKARIWAAVYGFSYPRAEPVADLIAEDCGREHDGNENRNVQYVRRGEHPGDKEERCAGKKKGEEDTALEKNDRREPLVAEEFDEGGEI